MKTPQSASPLTVLLPLGKKGAAFALAAGVIVSLCASFSGISNRNAFAYLHHPCDPEGVGYTQTGSPLGVQTPDLHIYYYPDGNSRCAFVGEWTPTHLNYWYLMLNGLYWTCIVYVVLLVPMHVLRITLSRER
jgi:hypothetical protein